MVKIYLSLFFYLVLLVHYCNGQQICLSEKDSDVVITVLDKFPCYSKNCDFSDYSNLLKFIKNNIIYPVTAQNDSLEGIVIIEYIVELDGTTSQHTILKSIREDIDKEALRVCKLIKYAKPAMQANKLVRVKMVLPIKFYLTK
jgi:TonB family protein